MSRNYEPRFVVGITGHMSLDASDVDLVGDAIRDVLDWLTTDPARTSGIRTLDALDKPAGLSASSIVLLSSLAPGIDQLAANIALKRDIEVMSPLPFPHDLSSHNLPGLEEAADFPVYRNASTFIRGKDDDEKRQRDFDAIVDRIGEENLFHVMRPEDIGLSDEEFVSQLTADIHDRVRRNYRYRAAGEYVAGTCDLLIAVCDLISPHDVLEDDPQLPADAQPGAAQVVESRLRGLTPRMLPGQTALTWADNGPVLRIFMPNRKKQYDKPLPKTGDIQVWHPGDSRPAGFAFEDWHAAEMDNLRTFSASFHDLHRRLAKQEVKDPRREVAVLLKTKASPRFVPQTITQACVQDVRRLCRQLTDRSSDDSREGDSTPAAPPNDKLQSIACVRRCVSNINRDADRQIKWLISWFLRIAVCVVLLVQLSEHWIPTSIQDADGASRFSVIQGCVFVLAMALSLCSGVMYFKSKRRGLSSLQNDYRAIAEGLRVQFYWTAAGTGESAAQRYLQRQRSDLSWIRAVISSVAMPVSEDRNTFATLSRREQLDRLERIRTGWLNEQECYFEKETIRLSHRSAWCHLWANSFLIAGFVLAFAVVAGFQRHLAPHIATFAEVWGRYALLHFSAVLVAAFACLQLLASYAWKQPGSRNGDATQVSNSASPSRRRNWLVVIHQLDKTANSWPTAFVLGIAMAVAILSTVFGVDLPREVFPAPNALTTFCKNVCFSMAGLLHASMAFSFLSQNIRRYSTMFGLFRGANQRMGRMLETLKQDRSPIESENTIRDIQNLLVDLGTEALNENSEWLQMHRTTPPAPIVSAG